MAPPPLLHSDSRREAAGDVGARSSTARLALAVSSPSVSAGRGDAEAQPGAAIRSSALSSAAAGTQPSSAAHGHTPPAGPTGHLLCSTHSSCRHAIHLGLSSCPSVPKDEWRLAPSAGRKEGARVPGCLQRALAEPGLSWAERARPQASQRTTVQAQPGLFPSLRLSVRSLLPSPTALALDPAESRGR